MHKKDVHIANRKRSNCMERQLGVRRGITAETVIGPIPGKSTTTVFTGVGTGSNYGSRKGIHYGG
jgi:hypothetical protein